MTLLLARAWGYRLINVLSSLIHHTLSPRPGLVGSLFAYVLAAIFLPSIFIHL